ncbi:MAG: phosphatase PAP2 family protein [Candidatus Aminicenantes bacterium]|nr:MAG: phosphatase PAP2 family protein [Candidatus Aminicenantes bacterium]
MKSRRWVVAGLEIGLTDVVTLGGLVLFTVMAAVFHRRIPHPLTVVGIGLLFIVLYMASLAAMARLRRPWPRFVLRTAAVQLTFLQVYRAANEIQLVFLPWQDDRVLAWEQALFGFQPVVAVQKFYTIPLSEWMFFVYVFYIVIYPVLGAVIFFRRGEEANEDYLFQLSLVNLACGLGFILFPVASPMHWEKVRALLTEPLTAGVFGVIAEWIRANIHQAGGSIPSPHCAVATVMWFMALKYTRRGFHLLAPIILSLYASTVYGRFHYLSDTIAGIATGIIVILAAPAIRRAWEGRPATVPGAAQ